jgi:hypothetical protein
LDVRLLLTIQRVEHLQLDVAAALGGVGLLFASGVGSASTDYGGGSSCDCDPGDRDTLPSRS